MAKTLCILIALLLKPLECYGSFQSYNKNERFQSIGKIYNILNQGVYTYVNKKTDIAHYVGMTNNFDRRDKEHKAADAYYTSSKYRLEKTNMPGATREQMYQEEKRQIKDKKPIANIYAGGNGPR